jgi:hypothetical protein
VASRELPLRPVQLVGEREAATSTESSARWNLEGPAWAKARRVTVAVLKVSGPVLLAVAACLFCYVAGWRGTDWAAQIYRVGQVARYGISYWDPGWYGGSYPLNYSLLYPVAAAQLGLWPLAALSCAGAALSFDGLVTGSVGRRPAASWYFALSMLVEVAIGQLPTLTGEALALGCAWCFARWRAAGGRGLRGRRPALFLLGGLGLGVATGLTTPVDGSFLALVLCAVAVADWGRSPRQASVEIGAAGLVMATSAALPLLFPGPGHFPFPYGDLLAVLSVCALLASPLLSTPRPVRAAALLYAGTSVALFVVPTPMGDNDARLGAYIGVPLVLCYLPRLTRRWRGQRDRRTLARAPIAHRLATRAVIVIVPVCLIGWHWGGIAETLGGAANGASSGLAFYVPLVHELDRLSKGQPVRVEVTPTQYHGESAYIAPAFSLARGWERQLDIAYNGLFYQTGELTPTSYRDWLLSNGVSYVALPDAPLDYAGTAEAALLRSGAIVGLQAVWHTAHWLLWRVSGSQGLASAPASVVSLSPKAVVVRFSEAGASVLKIRWAPSWSLAAAAGHGVCLMPGPGGWTEMRADHAGQFRLLVSVFGADHGNCPGPGGPFAHSGSGPPKAGEGLAAPRWRTRRSDRRS